MKNSSNFQKENIHSQANDLLLNKNIVNKSK